ncbi:aKG-HExxH-type peptide beta-hydroxylase [Blastococcus aggregatus]|nr:HEXXH motif-containing putative peptide modification protein [Blastococcus aggregatus]
MQANARAIVEFAGLAASTETPSRQELQQALNMVQRFPIPVLPDGPSLIWPDTPGFEERTLLRLMNEGVLPDGWQLRPDQQTELAVVVPESLNALTPLGDTRAAVDLLISGFFVARHPRFGGGSVSDVIGCIWLSPRRSWDVPNLAAVILHEYVHNALFLEDMVRSIFSESVPRMAEADGLTQSAILKERRGYDKAFHSAAVALELYRYRHELPFTVPALSLDAVAETLLECRERDQFLTGNGKDVLANMEDLLGALQESSRPMEATR